MTRRMEGDQFWVFKLWQQLPTLSFVARAIPKIRLVEGYLNVYHWRLAMSLHNRANLAQNRRNDLPA